MPSSFAVHRPTCLAKHGSQDLEHSGHLQGTLKNSSPGNE
eukprot:CAMPEP_0115733878 /NCGR_PEP_ID=MMETSP0272-20121206/85889_1 /TAXON_ID=71861 /ORGANISM="Scrippsiella trochoidea, Strain CCMP3099" /LENGTH=39 /DNA_ID= /DNA_START= /DNA_END= /DNA_ORIENTATION=